MKKQIVLTLILSLAALSNSACNTTTQWSRKTAAKLDESIGDYAAWQQQRISRVNGDYQRNHARLTSELEQLHDENLDVKLQEDATIVADRVLSGWKEQTLPSNIRSLFADRRTQQQERFDLADESIALARNEYAKAYEELQLKFSELKKARSNLQALSVKHSSNDLILHFAKGVQDLVKEIETKSADAIKKQQVGEN